MKIDTLLSPLELPELLHLNLRGTVCVVFDVLRATSTFVTALQHGARAIIPVCEITEALARRQQRPEVLLAGERHGMRIRAVEPGGTDFDFGNSPREFTPEKVCGKTIVSTTTNGTRALQACAQAKIILAASFLNLAATARFLQSQPDTEILLVCAGTGNLVALEDVMAAGALVELLAGPSGCSPTLSDSSAITRHTFIQARDDLPAAIGGSTNGRRLKAIPELAPDIAFCAQENIFDLVAAMAADGCLQRVA